MALCSHCFIFIHLRYRITIHHWSAMLSEVLIALSFEIVLWDLHFRHVRCLLLAELLLRTSLAELGSSLKWLEIVLVLLLYLKSVDSYHQVLHSIWLLPTCCGWIVSHDPLLLLRMNLFEFIIERCLCTVFDINMTHVGRRCNNSWIILRESCCGIILVISKWFIQLVTASYIVILRIWIIVRSVNVSIALHSILVNIQLLDAVIIGPEYAELLRLQIGEIWHRLLSLRSIYYPWL